MTISSFSICQQNSMSQQYTMGPQGPMPMKSGPYPAGQPGPMQGPMRPGGYIINKHHGNQFFPRGAVPPPQGGHMPMPPQNMVSYMWTVFCHIRWDVMVVPVMLYQQ